MLLNFNYLEDLFGAYKLEYDYTACQPEVDKAAWEPKMDVPRYAEALEMAEKTLSTLNSPGIFDTKTPPPLNKLVFIPAKPNESKRNVVWVPAELVEPPKECRKMWVVVGEKRARRPKFGEEVDKEAKQPKIAKTSIPLQPDISCLQLPPF